jgi:CrcB protein
MPQPIQPSFLTASLLVALGGGLGSWLRFVAGRGWIAALGPVRASAFPWGTLSVNIAGSLAMGLLTGWLARAGVPGGSHGEATRLLLAVGVLGGFTTFSSFSLETVSLLERGQPGVALLYLAISLAAGLLGLWLGLLLMRSAV